MPRYRRAAHLVSYWQDDRLVLHNYASGLRAAVAPLTIAVLEHCATWRTLSAIARAIEVPDGVPLDTILAVLVEATFLERSDRRPSAAARAFASWNGWNPAAGFFHASTKNVPYATLTVADEGLRQKAIHDPPPAMLKSVTSGKSGRKGPRVDLPAAATLPGLTEPLVSRRTWRRFGSGRVSRTDLATLLHLTWGVQHWVQVDGFGRMPLKTSPSGGARHGIEAYALIRRVEGVRPGLYHYEPDDHRLARVGSPRRRISAYLPTQTWYDDAAVVVFMTAVFARVQWRYGSARAYRGVLAEAGHLAQTFCVIATRLGLAPFCSMALADTVIEQDLGIDGVSESVVYAAGAGIRPDGVAWAPWPDTEEMPARTSPAWARRPARRPALRRKSGDA